MVKGVNKRVIMVKSPDPRLFEQAIFIMREDAFQTEGVSADKVLEEAKRVAQGYVRQNSRLGKLVRAIPAPAYAAFGALAATFLWSIAVFLW